jgi:DHA2 family multidrug resistance protein
MASTTSQPDHAEYADYSTVERWTIMAALMLGALMQVIDTSIVNVAIPHMMGNLGATVDQIGWVSTGYIISCVIVLPLTGWLSSTFGRKRYLTASIILFTAASFFCGTSRSLNALVFFRVLQGIGGAALVSTAQATMMEIFPPQQLGMVQAIYGIGIMVGPTIGPTLGGWITDNYSWPWVFFINIPIGALAVFLAYTFVHNSRFERTNNRVDLVGIALLAIGLGSLQTLLEKGNREDWFQSPLIVWLFITALIGITTFVIWELRQEHPAVNLHILKNKAFSAGVVFTAVVGFGLFGGTFVLPIYLQQLRNYTAEQSGFALFPGAIATAIMMAIAGRIANKYPARTLVFIGSGGIIVSMLMLSRITLDTGPNDLWWPLIIRGAALGLNFLPLTLATLTILKGREIADGTGLFNLSRQIGGSLGIAILSTFIDHRTTIHRASLVEHINVYSPEALQRLHALQGAMMAKGASFAVARQQALAIIDRIINAQASVMAFEDVFRVVAIVFLAGLPLLLLLKKGIATSSHSGSTHAE